MADQYPSIELDDELILRAHGHMARGFYGSLDDVLIAAFEALDRETEAFDANVREKIAEALADPGPFLPLEDAFAQLDAAKAKRRA